MENKKNIWILIIVLTIYILNQLFLKHLGILFFNNHLNDLLAVPLFFALINTISLYNTNKQVTSLKYLIFITILLAFLGEYVAIYLRPGSVSDWWDVLCYFIGMFVYYLIINIEHETD
ncbi:hypothetical protein [uncultured Methanobrevibacter sp.]|uniref:hypothetical protein n=1 Tax=uncultured Methanobrevibacter sp. TaxID=253161 RepID=UPI002618AA7C|nr:hypothetical protein [uncultured Methanobrevibacter sp.]